MTDKLQIRNGRVDALQEQLCQLELWLEISYEDKKRRYLGYKRLRYKRLVLGVASSWTQHPTAGASKWIERVCKYEIARFQDVLVDPQHMEQLKELHKGRSTYNARVSPKLSV